MLQTPNSPNGVMKTSFAKTFIDLSKGESSKDFKNQIKEYIEKYNENLL